MKRSAGVLLHITSLPNEYGCGNFGHKAYEFVDELNKIGFTYWQILPFSIPDEDNCPYNSHSSFFGNPLLIDIEELLEKQLLSKEEIDKTCKCFNEENHLLFYKERIQLLKKAYQRCTLNDIAKHQEFISKNSLIEKAVLYFAYKDANDNKDWQQWNKNETKNIGFYNFLAYYFYNQWFKLKKYANDKGIKIIGDVPIYVNLESADVFFNKDVFRLEKDNYLKYISGVPGQIWGHPLYNLGELKETNYKFLIERFSFFTQLFDMIRIDHFRAFSSYYVIEKGHDSYSGKWYEGVGDEFINLLTDYVGDNKLIAEDVGGYDKGTQELLKKFNIPGMNILEYFYDVSKYKKNSIAYTTTHDNNTLLGFIDRFNEDQKQQFKEILHIDADDNIKIANEAIQKIINCDADIFIIPMQDILIQNEEKRMNVPGTIGNNWYYQMSDKDFNDFKNKEKEWHILINNAKRG